MITTHQLRPRPMKIGFCFLVKNSISNESLWNNFFKPAEANKFSIYIHAKTSNVESILPNVFVDPNPLPTEWASISLVHATKRLLDTPSLMVAVYIFYQVILFHCGISTIQNYVRKHYSRFNP